ncbi:MAG: hypothetical protein ACR2KZ_15730 [Segetibacter sp.]
MPHFEDKLNNTQKVAILRANALGDFIVTLPAYLRYEMLTQTPRLFF